MDHSRITITICGDGGCGKSSITLRLVRSAWTSSYDPTIEDSYSITRQIDGKTYHLSLTDTAGQEEYRGMWASSNASSDAFLLVYDITSADSLYALEEFNTLIDIESENRLEKQQRAVESRRNMSRRERDRLPTDPSSWKDLVTVPVKIVAGNKCDLQESRTVSSKTGLEWARRHGCGFMETSARNTVNIEETFALIVRRVVEARRIAAVDAGLIAEEEGFAGRPPRLGIPGAGGLAGNRTLPPGGLRFDGDDSGVGTRRAPTAPLSPLPTAEEKMVDEPVVRRRWWRKMLCWR